MQDRISQADGSAGAPDVEAHVLSDDGVFPNNSELPLLLYRQVLDVTGPDATERILERFAQNHWGAGWVNGIYGFHHYHSTAHEVLGIASGQAQVQLGGEKGLTATVKAGDVAHKNLDSSADFTVVGAYPQGQHPDMCDGKPGERPETIETIVCIPLPKSDPVAGPGGPLMHHWSV